MDDRKDAAAAAAEAIVAIEALIRELDRGVVATVGEIDVHPEVKNVIPGACSFSLDVRSGEDDLRSLALTLIHESIDKICKKRGVEGSIEVTSDIPAEPMTPNILKVLNAACQRVGVEPHRLMSGAGHDAQSCARAGIPTGMIFVRSTGGSHNPREYADPADAAVAARVLLAACVGIQDGNGRRSRETP